MADSLFASIIERYDAHIFRGPNEYVIRIDVSEDAFFEFWGPTLMDAALSASEWVEAQPDQAEHDYSEDNNGNLCQVADTDYRMAVTDFMLRDWQLITEPGVGYVAEEDDQGRDRCLRWYGPGRQFGTAQEVLEWLAARGVAYRKITETVDRHTRPSRTDWGSY